MPIATNRRPFFNAALSAENDNRMLATNRVTATVSVPTAPTITSPISASTLTDTTPDIVWGAVDGALTYEVQIATDSGFTAQVSLTGNTGIATTSYTTAPALGTSYILYYVRVRGVNGAGNGDWSAAVSFYVADTTLVRFWLDPTQGIYSDAGASVPAIADGDLVRVAQDASGNTNHASADSDAARYTLKTGANGINGRPVLRSDGTTSLMTTTSFLTSGFNKAFTSLMVIKSALATDALKVYAGTGGSLFYLGRDLYDEYFRFQNGGGTTKIGYTRFNNPLWIAIASYDGTSMKLMLNGNYKTVSSTANLGFTGTALTIGDYSSGGFKHAWDIAEMKVWNAGMSLAQMQNLAGWAATRYNQPLCTKRIVVEGDSLTVGVGAPAGSDYPSQMMAAYNDPGYYLFNVATSGNTLAQIVSQATRQVNTAAGTNVGAQLAIWAGTNDLKNGFATGAATYNTYVTYCNARRTAGLDVVAMTILPRNDSGIVAGFETERQVFNSSVRSNWATFADALADVAADTRIGDAGDENDLTYYDADKVHMTAAGYTIVAGLVKAAIDSIT